MSIRVNELLGYAGQTSVFPGQEVQLHVSTPAPAYDIALIRLGEFVDETREQLDVCLTRRGGPGRVQPISPGSYVAVDRIGAPEGAFAAEVWVYPTLDDRRMTVFACATPAGAGRWRLLLDGGRPTMVHDGWPAVAAGQRLPLGSWTHLAVCVSAEGIALYVDGGPAAVAGGGRGAAGGGAWRLRIGASFGADGGAAQLLNGRVALPVVYERALGEAEVAQRVAARGLPGELPAGAIGAWHFGGLQREWVEDLSGKGHPARVVNHGGWAFPGPSFDARALARPGYAPEGDPQRGAALRLCQDDLHDCRWEVTDTVTVPPDARSGLYTVRLTAPQAPAIPSGAGGRPAGERVTGAASAAGEGGAVHDMLLVVKPRPERRARLAVLAPTFTWLAYNNWPGSAEGTGRGGCSLYVRHVDGSAGCYAGENRPQVMNTPYRLYQPACGGSHLARADRYLLGWLDRKGYAWDLYADHDLDLGPDVLAGYDAVVINGHSEYWTAAMRAHLKAYLDGGGHVLHYSGNTMDTRVSYDRATRLLEGRKYWNGPGTQMDGPAEVWHGQDGQKGNRFVDLDLPTHAVLGVTTLGFTGCPFAPYRVSRTDHPLFGGTGLKDGDLIGTIGLNGGAASGHEFDVLPHRFPDFPGYRTAGPLPGRVTLLGEGLNRVTQHFGYYRRYHGTVARGADLIFLEYEAGGWVFGASSIAAGGSVAVDHALSRLTENALALAGVHAPPFAYDAWTCYPLVVDGTAYVGQIVIAAGQYWRHDGACWTGPRPLAELWPDGGTGAGAPRRVDAIAAYTPEHRTRPSAGEPPPAVGLVVAEGDRIWRLEDRLTGPWPLAALWRSRPPAARLPGRIDCLTYLFGAGDWYVVAGEELWHIPPSGEWHAPRPLAGLWQEAPELARAPPGPLDTLAAFPLADGGYGLFATQGARLWAFNGQRWAGPVRLSRP